MKAAMALIIGYVLVAGLDFFFGFFSGLENFVFNSLVFVATTLLIIVRRSALWPFVGALSAFFVPDPHYFYFLSVPPFGHFHGFVGWRDVLTTEAPRFALSLFGFGLIWFTLGRGSAQPGRAALSLLARADP